MHNSSADILEFEALRALLGRYVASPLGRAELERAAPGFDRDALETALADASEALRYLQAATQPQPASRGSAIRIRFDSIPDIAESVALLRIEGAGLEAGQIVKLTSFLGQAAEMRGLLVAASEKYPRLAATASRIADLRPLLRELSGKILPDGSLSDDASVALHRLRRDIEKQQKQIQISLERFLRAHRDNGTLQEEFITIRNDRFVVPVVAGHQRKMQGVIHGASGTGHTLFVEPLETIDLNNDLVRLREEEQREVLRILREMTDSLRAHAGAIADAAAAAGELEFVFAKAAFAIDFNCTIPRFSPDGSRRLLLREARHPLLEDVLRKQRKPIVPISLSLEESCRTLLISGPNTGGKSVSMKTVGLLALMAQAGLPVPAVEAEFPLFDQVLADVGDNQSILESLSTFSAHIAHVREMLENVTRDSLVLLDELGRATDPEEGGALGVAVLDTFRSSGAFTLASTHLLALKVFGANTAGVVNASMGFDELTLEPTYILRLGAPGKSAGLDIASRLGMPPAMIERARGAMSTAERDISRFLGELHARLESVAEAERLLEEAREALAAREGALAREWEQRETAKLREVERRCESAIAEFEAQARETINRVLEGADQRKAAEQATRRVAKTRREFQDRVQSSVLAKTPAAKPALAIEEGSRVRLKGIREPARVRRKLSEGRLEVQAGLMKMQVSIDDVEDVLPDAPDAGRLPRNVTFQPAGPAWDGTYREINVVGQRAEEARDIVDKFLDNAAAASVERIRIVHGHGMGVLRRVVAELLADNPHVAKFYSASQSEGGTGATIVELKGFS
ncbi:MAG: Smr/MutS family protein [Acidobacteriota bacterium]|nr:Smr/MutS family protein [Acidobacteriota bacterium]